MDNASDLNQTQAAPAAQGSAEKMVPQSQVNEIVGNAKREAAERAIETYRRQQAQSASQVQAEPQYQGYANPARNASEEDVKRVANDEIKKHFDQLKQEAQERMSVAEANRVVSLFKEKVLAGKDKYEDFDTVAGSVAMQHYPNVVHLLAEHVDNSADVLYHLAKNRSKLSQLEFTCAHNSPDAIYEIKRLSDSIKANDDASQMKNAKAPLSQTRPSNIGTDSGGGSLSIADLKRKYRG